MRMVLNVKILLEYVSIKLRF